MKQEFFVNNRQKYSQQVIDNSLSIFFSGRTFPKSADEDYPFEVDKNFYYLAGINQANVMLVITKKGRKVQETLFIEQNDEILSKWVGRKLTLEEASQQSGIEKVMYADEFNNFVFALLNNSRYHTERVKNVYLNLERRNDDVFTNPALEFSQHFLRKKYPEVAIHNAYEIVIGLRMIKAPEEISLIRESIKTTKAGIESLMAHSKAGLYEYQLEAYFDFAIKSDGQKDFAFKSIAGSGKNGATLHYVANNKIMENGDLVLFDLGSRTEFYVSDITRTFPINGKFSARQKAVYQAVLDVNKKCIAFLKPGITWKEYNDFAKDLLTKAAFGLGLIKDEKELVKYYFHSIGHFTGLDTHDPGLNEQALAKDMVLTVEPGLYIEEENLGIRIEDNVVITEDGAENLSKEIIKEIPDIEKFMAASKK